MEYALLVGSGVKRSIVTVVMTTKPIDDVKAQHPGYEVVPLHELPDSIREHYQFWDSRP